MRCGVEQAPGVAVAVLSGLLLSVVGLAGSTSKPATESPPHTAPASASCVTPDCHADLRRYQRVHQPASTDACDLCHLASENSTPYESGEKHKFSLTAPEDKLCTMCHVHLAEQSFVHDPVLGGTCVICHDPHAADFRLLLRVWPERVLCLQCHEDTYTSGSHVHGPVALGHCNTCHDPHQSSLPYLLRSTGADACGECHLARQRQIRGARFPHQPDAEACNQCHDPHNGHRRYRLRKEAAVLCLECHEQTQRELANGQSVHKPIEETGCADCHLTHGSDCRALLPSPYSEHLYEPFSVEAYLHCFDCHDPALVLKDETDNATEFRNGPTNLHFVHVYDPENGRTCRTCHEVHASGPPKLVAETVAYGKWQLPVNYHKTETGGGCVPGCHRAKTYDRLTPVPSE